MDIGIWIRAIGYTLYFAILARVIVSWILPGRTDNPIVAFIIQITDPILAPIRRVLPQMGMFDLSPMVALILLTVIIQVLLAVVP